MKWLVSILALFCAVEVHAQPSPINRRAMVISGLAHVPGPETIGGLALRWVASDTVAGGTVTNSVDRIQGFHAVQTVTGQAPTNNALGWWFNPNHPDFLTVTNWTFTTGSDAFFIVYRMEFLKSTVSDMAILFAKNDGGSAAMIYGSSTPANQVWTLNAFVTMSGKPISTNIMQCVLHNTKTAGATYTNGVDTTVSTSLNTFAVNWIGQTITNAGTLRSWEGYIAEICVWTNTQMTAGNNTTLYNYAKSTYGVP